MPKKLMLHCQTKVNSSSIKRTVINNVEHIIIKSKTLPDDIVMNGGLYPAEEIQKSYQTLERTLAPIEHPHDENGDFLQANDPVALAKFYAGAHNENVKRVNGVVTLDKVINVQEANKSERGKRLLDRISNIENSENADPIHTSTGLFLDVEELDEVQTNSKGQAYKWIARNMIFDHDAILLDSVGAAQPDQGVGMALNKSGDRLNVTTSLITIDGDTIQSLSSNELRRLIEDALQDTYKYAWVSDLFEKENTVIFENEGDYFSVGYEIDDAKSVKIVGIPVEIERVTTYVPKNKTNHDEGEAMKEEIVKKLNDAGIQTEGLSDTEVLAKYNTLMTNQTSNGENSEESADIADVVANAVSGAVKPLQDEIDSLSVKLNEQDDKQHEKNAELVGNSDKFPGVDVDDAKKLDKNVLAKMAGNCLDSHGLPLNEYQANSGEDSVKFDMPE